MFLENERLERIENGQRSLETERNGEKNAEKLAEVPKECHRFAQEYVGVEMVPSFEYIETEYDPS